MTTYARIKNNTAVEVFVPPAGFTLADCFHADVAPLFAEVPDGTEAGATTADNRKTWTNPPIQPASAPAPTVYDLLTPTQFYLAFTSKERQMIKALASDSGIPSTSSLNPTPGTAIPKDADIEEFWATFQIALTGGAHIDPNLASTQESLGYLASPTAPTPVVITAARIPQILAGVAQ
ncbi:hypothetical protein [Paraburkholderia sp. RL18-085-BIA-A]|uniref:hypothetical protein n=1 Tax=Paraburkholderia sp. RL18-085-BIA-A TaxID=3031633 RepID=UPI0038B93495